MSYVDVELFAGGGGLALGLRAAGFSPSHLYEVDSVSCETLRKNLRGARATLEGSVTEIDVGEVDWKSLGSTVRLLAAGAPCQPFSLAGKHRADRDGRNLFPEVLRAVRALRPLGVLIENVRGLLRPDFEPYLGYIVRQLQWPSIAPLVDERWQDHDRRIRAHIASNGHEPEYSVSRECLNAADFGVPQLRYRVFLIAVRRGLPSYSFPERTHSRDALIETLVSGKYFDKRGIPQRADLGALRLSDQKVLHLEPWVTVRDALEGLRDAAEERDGAWQNHWVIPGARLYPRHKGSDLDWPSKTIKAGVHGVPGGENVIRVDDGGYRYYTLREAARLQTFPDRHSFEGTRSAITKQIGNAVPCRLAEAVARPLHALLSDSRRR